MAYSGGNHYGWSPSNWYERAEEQRRFDGSGHHHPKGKKGHVAFKTEPEEVAAPQGINQTAHQGVDDEADAFIKSQHRRIELSKLMSMRAAGASV